MANMWDCDIRESKFELQSLYFIHFGIIILARGIDP